MAATTENDSFPQFSFCDSILVGLKQRYRFLLRSETQSEWLQGEMRSLEYQTAHVFTTPPHKWIAHRLNILRETLNQNTSLSAEPLKGLLGSIYLEQKFEKDPNMCHIGEFKPHYVAHTKILTLSFLDDEHKGSNWYEWRRE